MYDHVHKKIISSKDVKFDESQGWNWEAKPQQSQPIQDIMTEAADESEIVIEEQETLADNNDEHHSNHEEGSDYEDNTNTLPPRVRKPPGWVRDYVTNLEDGDSDQLQNLAMFSTNEDPSCYEDAVKSVV
jgi:hypothetical protein